MSTCQEQRESVSEERNGKRKRGSGYCQCRGSIPTSRPAPGHDHRHAGAEVDRKQLKLYRILIPPSLTPQRERVAGRGPSEMGHGGARRTPPSSCMPTKRPQTNPASASDGGNSTVSRPGLSLAFLWMQEYEMGSTSYLMASGHHSVHTTPLMLPLPQKTAATEQNNKK